MLRISGIRADGLPDADKSVGGGGSDPYVKFTLETNLNTGNINTGSKFHARTNVIDNASRFVSFPDRLEIPLPEHAGRQLVSGACEARLRVAVWDDDSMDDGADDLMGELTTDVRTPSFGAALRGSIVRATAGGVDGFYPFFLSFRYACASETEKLKKEREREIRREKERLDRELLAGVGHAE